jgi:hypothetical protein
MIQFDKPAKLNGEELRAELKAAGVTISDNFLAVQDDAEGNLLLDISATNKTKATAVVAAHIGTI